MANFVFMSNFDDHFNARNGFYAPILVINNISQDCDYHNF